MRTVNIACTSPAATPGPNNRCYWIPNSGRLQRAHDRSMKNEQWFFLLLHVSWANKLWARGCHPSLTPQATSMRWHNLSHDLYYTGLTATKSPLLRVSFVPSRRYSPPRLYSSVEEHPEPVEGKIHGREVDTEACISLIFCFTSRKVCRRVGR